MAHRPTDNPIIYLYNKLTPDKVLDVSAMTEHGKGIVTITAPKTTRSKKYFVEGLRIVSTNPESYERAIYALGPEYYNYIERFRTIFENAERDDTTLRTTLINPPPAIPLPQQLVNLTAPLSPQRVLIPRVSLSPPRVRIPTVPLSPPRVTIPGVAYLPPTIPLTHTALPIIIPLGQVTNVTIPISPTQAKCDIIAPTLPTIVALGPMTERTIPQVPRIIIPTIPQVARAIHQVPHLPQVTVVQVPGIRQVPNIPRLPGFGLN